LQAKRRAELAKKRVQQTHFFSPGNWEPRADVLRRFLRKPEVERLLPGSARQTRSEQADAKFAAEVLSAAKRFLGRDRGHTEGRRSESDTNAFWAAISALVPAGLLEDRGGRAASRILGKGSRRRAGAQWSRGARQGLGAEYSGHSDRVGMQIVADWRHSDLASTEDNQNEMPIRVNVDEPRRAIAQCSAAAEHAVITHCRSCHRLSRCPRRSSCLLDSVGLVPPIR